MKNRFPYQNLACLSLAACALPLAASTVEIPDPIDLTINPGLGIDNVPGDQLAVFIVDERAPSPLTEEIAENPPPFAAFVFSDGNIDPEVFPELAFFSDLFVSIDDMNHVEVIANPAATFDDFEDGDDLDPFREFQVYTGDAFGDGTGPFVSADETREFDLSQQPDSDWGFSVEGGPFEEGDSFQFGFRYRGTFPDTAALSLIDVPSTEITQSDFFYGRGEITIGSVQATGFQVSGAQGSPITLGGATVNPIPEPSSAMALAGLLTLGLLGRRRP